MFKKGSIVITFALFIVSTLYAEKIDLEVYASKFDSIPIGILDFKNVSLDGSLQENIPWKIIANDLDFSGRFSVFSFSSFDSAAFSNASVGIYIDGQYTIEGSSVTLDCYLRDVASKELIIGKKYKGELKFLRGMAHRYANEIVEMLFGDRGIFESRILFVRQEGQKKHVAVMDFDGFNQQNLTKNSVINIFPTFADASSVLWVSYLRGKPDIYKGSLTDGTSKILIYSRYVQSSPDVSPIDGRIVYASSKRGNMDIYVCDSDGKNERQLTADYGVDTAPCWSPNGYQIAFTSDRSGSPQIYIMDGDGGNQRRITYEGKYQDSPAWSPKGDKIAYSSMINNKFEVFTISPDGKNSTRVTNSSANNEYPSWSPDGNLIVFASSSSGRSDLYVIRPDGTRLRRVTATGDVRMPSWSGF